MNHSTPLARPVEVGAAMTAPALSVTEFKGTSALEKIEQSFTETDLAEFIANPPEAASKEQCRLIKLGRFGDKRTKKGSLRSDKNLLAVSGAEGDYDGEQVPMQEAAGLCAQAGIRAMFYTSPSHTPEKPRWRVLVPFSKECQPSDRNRHLARLNGVLGGILSGESFTLSQTFYVGHVNGSHYEHADIQGDYIDQLSGLDAREVWPDAAKARQNDKPEFEGDKLPALIHQAMSGENYHEALNRIAASYVKRGMKRDDVIAVLRAMMLSHRTDNIDRWQARYDDIPRAVDSAIEKFAPEETQGGDYQAISHIREAIYSPASIAPEAIPPRDWVYREFALAGYISGIAAPGGTGKSAFTLTVAVSVALGRDLLSPININPPKQRNVLVINNEDDQHELNRRIAGICQHYGIDLKQLNGKLFLRSGYSDPAVLAKKGTKDAPIITTAHRDELIEFINEHEVGLVIADPLVSLHTLNENDNMEQNEVVKILRHICGKTGAAVVLVAHTHKTRSALSKGTASDHFSGDANLMRGASAIKDGARIVYTMERLADRGEEACKLYDIDDDLKRRMVFLSDAKTNFSLRSNSWTWLRQASVQLPNGDSVGVLEHYDLEQYAIEKPVSKDQAEKVTATGWAEQIEQVIGDLPNKSKFRYTDLKARLITETGYSPATVSERVTLLSQCKEKPTRISLSGRLIDYWIARSGKGKTAPWTVHRQELD